MKTINIDLANGGRGIDADVIRHRILEAVDQPVGRIAVDGATATLECLGETDEIEAALDRDSRIAAYEVE